MTKRKRKGKNIEKIVKAKNIVNKITNKNEIKIMNKNTILYKVMIKMNEN